MQINVARAVVEILDRKAKQASKRDNVFSITSDTDEVLILQATSLEERNDWLRVLAYVSRASVERKGTLSKKMQWKKVRMCDRML